VETIYDGSLHHRDVFSLVETLASILFLHGVSKNITTLIMNNCYKLEPILIIFGMLYAETTGF